MQYGLIMAGGSGTRLWPLSRADTPKQILPVVNGQSLLQLSYQRLRGMLPPERIFVCTGAVHAKGVLENLSELPRENLLGEPMGRDTANAVGFSAAVLHKRDPDAVCAVVTADHVIEPVEVFQQSLNSAFQVIGDRPRSLVTFGIVPTYGHTGLGYIHRGDPLGVDGAYQVLGFHEKPDKALADRFVESGRYYWNSGMFVWRCDTVLSELAIHLPGSHKGLAQIAQAWGTPQQETVLRDVYPRLPKISIDYAVMEPASQHKGNASVVVVEMPVDWTDVGSWPALAEILPVDEHNNAVSANTALFLDSDDNVIFSQDPNHLISTIGVSDMIVVHANDATLICPKDQAQRVKELVAKVKEKYGGKFQ
ncbi:MAG TPA: sugar phosphate nucleotidyltransferase [Tepidisphaeraceae bacterium]|jgi:mannose-1-phosphate guanylyltransferase|nr:sugar phosphate nucleotidyltransferase [Tepidisphaeraceae bacterium]